MGRLSGFRLVGLSVGRSVGRSVCHYILKGWEVSLPYSYRSTCFHVYISYLSAERYLSPSPTKAVLSHEDMAKMYDTKPHLLLHISVCIGLS